jgi:hypothetical protein
MRVNIQVNQRDLARFNDALRKYRDFRQMDNADALNRAGMNLAGRAVQFTHRASAEQIKALMHQESAVEIRGKKRFTKSYTEKRARARNIIYAPTTAAKMIMIWHMRRGTLFYKGFPNKTDPKKLSDAYFAELVRRYAGRRISSAAYIAAGWLPAFYKFQAAYRGSDAVKPRLARKRMGDGTASIAVAGDKPFAELINRSATRAPGSADALVKYGGEGMAKAIKFVGRDMLGYIKKQLAKRSADFNQAR